MRALLFVFALALPPLFGQNPYINYRGIVNAGSYARPGLPAGSIARGSIFSIFGRNFGPAQLTQQPSFPLNATLGGVSVQVSQGTTVLDAYPIAVLSGFANVVLPSNTPLGRVKVIVNFGGRASNPAWINVVDSSVGLFSLGSNGLGPGVVQNYVTGTDTPINTSRVSAKPGQILFLWGTGLGAVAHADNIAPTQVDISAADTEIFVGGKLAPRRYAGRSACCSGVDVIVFDVPSDAPEGCYVPIQVRTKHAVVSNTVTVAINRTGGPCTDSFNPVANALRAGGKLGVGMPLRTAATQQEIDGSIALFTIDEFYAAFRQLPALDTYFDPATSLPPLGSCTTYFIDAARSPGQLLEALPGTAIGAGSSVELSTAGATRPIVANPLWKNLIGGLIGKSTAAASPLFWNSGPFTLNIATGPSIGPLNATFNSITPVTWPTTDLAAPINRTSGLTLHWSGGDPANEIALIAGAAGDSPSNSQALFICTAPLAAGTFAVPPEILAALPRSTPNSISAPAWIYLANLRILNPIHSTGPGLDSLFIIPAAAQMRSTEVQ